MSTAAMPVAAPPIAMLTLPAAVVHNFTEPGDISVLTVDDDSGSGGGAGAAAAPAAVKYLTSCSRNLLLEHPERPATRMAARAIATAVHASPCALPVVAVHRH